MATTDTISTLRTSYNTLANEVGSSSRAFNVANILAGHFPFWITAASSTLSPTSTLFSSGLSLFTGGSFNASGTITINGVPVSSSSATGVSTSAANTWSALQTFINGISFNTATGTSNTSTISAGSAFFGSVTATTSTIGTAIISIIASSSNAVNYGLFSTDVLNVTSTSVFGSTISGTAGAFSGVFSVQTLNVTGTATLANLNVTNGNEYRRHTVTAIIMNPSTTDHSTGTVAIQFPVAATINSISCYSRPSGSSSIIMDSRVSSTPATAGTSILTSFDCTTTAVATTTIDSSAMAATRLLNIKINGVTGAPSSSVIHIIYTNDD